MKKLLSILLLLPVIGQALLPPPPATTAEVSAGTDSYKYVTPYTLAQAGISASGGAAVSNVISLTFVAGTGYTNDTDYYAEVSAMADLTANGAQAAVLAFLVDTNQDGTWDWSDINTSFTSSGGTLAFNNPLGATIPPGAVFRYDDQSTGGGAASVEATTGRIVYYSTNSGSGGGGSGDVTEAGLAAGSYDVWGALVVSNEVYTLLEDNTNALYAQVTAGTVAARGNYFWNSTTESFTNTTGCGIYYDGLDYFLTNASSLYLGSGLTGSGVWSEDSGASPPPEYVFGTNTTYYTNVIYFPTNATLLLSPASTNSVYVSATQGDDYFARKGDATRPYRTVLAAVTNAAPGDVVFVSAGNYSESFTLNSVSLVGQGASRTRFTNSRIDMRGTNITLSSFYIQHSEPVFVGTGGNGATNVTITDLEIEGSNDAIYLDSYDNLTVRDCKITSNWDCVADYSVGSSNAVATFWNCSMSSHYSAANPKSQTPVSLGKSQMIFNGCTMSASNNPTGDNYCLISYYLGVAQSELARITLNDCTLTAGTTNGSGQYLIKLNTNSVVTISGNAINPTAISAVSGAQVHQRGADSLISAGTSTNYTATDFIPTLGRTKLVSSNNAVYSVSTTKTNLLIAP